MSDEERQRQMDFIVNTLANVTVRLDGLTEKVDGMAAVQAQVERERQANAVRISRLEESFVTLTQLSQRFFERLDDHEGRIGDVEQAMVMLTKLVSEGRNGQ